MSHKVVFGRRASNDLEELLVYLAPKMGVQQARSYVGKIQAYCLGFSTFPKRGTLRQDIRPGLRLVGYRYKATIAFFVHEDIVLITRIFHRGRNVDLDETEDFD